jgi:hypothetical protein
MGSMCDKEFYSFVIVFINGRLQWGLAIIIFGVDVGTVREEEFCHFFAYVPGVQRGVAVPASGVDISAMCQ